MSKFFLTTFIILLALILSPTFVFAQDIGLDNSLKTITETGGLKTDVASEAFLNTTVGGIIAIVLGFVGIIFLGLTIYSGIQWMTAGGSEEKVTGAKKKITNATVGLAVVILAYVISNAVFSLFYQVSDRASTGLSNPGEIQCTDSDQCPGNYVCVNNSCVLLCQTDEDCEPLGPTFTCSMLTGQCQSTTCESNANCPVNAPICYNFGLNPECTCTGNGVCPSNKPHCILLSSQSPFNPENPYPAVCVQCGNGVELACPPNQVCNLSTFTCENAEQCTLIFGSQSYFQNVCPETAPYCSTQGVCSIICNEASCGAICENQYPNIQNVSGICANSEQCYCVGNNGNTCSGGSLYINNQPYCNTNYPYCNNNNCVPNPCYGLNQAQCQNIPNVCHWSNYACWEN